MVSKLNKRKSTIREWGCEVKAAYTTQPLSAALESAQENIYFLEVQRIDNVLSAHLYEMEREKQQQWAGRAIAQKVKKARTHDR